MAGTPQRPLRSRVPALILGAVGLFAFASSVAAQTPLVANGDFADGVSGWSGVRAQLTAEGDAARVTAKQAGWVAAESQWWHGGTVTPGASYRLDLGVLENDPRVETLTARIEFLDAQGGSAGELSVPPAAISSDAPGFRPLTFEAVAPAGSMHVRVVVEASVDAPGASFLIDGVTITQVGAAPAVTPTVQPSPEPTPTATPRATATPRTSATPARTATPSPPAMPIGPELRNASFEDGDAGWKASRGWVDAGPGGSLLLHADGASTAWMEQAVTVTPGRWYEASALLAPVEGVRAGWVRVAWYASTDASGSQMATDDSEVVGGNGLAIVVASGTTVSTGAVQAPAGARSAKVRVLVQPSSGSGAALAVDDVTFEETAPPAAPTATPTPVATPATLAAVTPSATPPAGGTRTAPPRTPAPVAPSVVASAEGQDALRITEVLADAVQPGRDAEYEWVELTNLGGAVVDLGGMVLRDADGATALSALAVAPGASVVLAGALAEVDADARLDGPIGNGLGNEADRLELVDAAGVVVDTVEWGSGTDLLPEAGESVQRWFDGSGEILGAGVGTPSPGVHAPLLTPSTSTGEVVDGPPEDDREPVAAAAAVTADGPDITAWTLLIAVGSGVLGGVVSHRAWGRRG